MADNIECEICGGTDFYKESGYFYCKECQTQSQEVREHVFQEEIQNLRGLRKVKKDKNKKLDNKVSSWECYNIVICSLAEQLIHLGADKSLKPIVKCLWMKYLEKLEVIDLKRDMKPRLQLVNSSRDRDIIYGTLRKKRKRTKSSDTSSVISLPSNSLKGERTKKKRALAQAQYEEFSEKSALGTESLHNETLASLKSPSEKSEKNEEPINFNRYGTKELKKKLSSGHIRKHKIDKKCNLQCHKLTYENSSEKYIRGIYFLSPIKLYCILYLGLLINRDQIQLGDILRFIREGHVAFNNYTELFPEEYRDKFLNIHNNRKNYIFSSKTLRMTAAKIAVFLDVTSYIQTVNLTSLCQRYCKEMNLPDEVYAAVRNIISKVNPKLSFTHKSKTIPNYEGRAMSIILFTLKLLFGLDGVTEWEMSRYAKLVNTNIKPNMFDIINWMEYISYRNCVITKHHFPSMYVENSNDIDSDLFLQCISSQETKVNETIKLTQEMDHYKELLTKIMECQEDYCTYKKFPPSLTPFLEYFEVLNLPKCQHYCFQANSLDFLLRPNKYLHLISNNLQLKHGGANDNWVIENLSSFRKTEVVRDSDLNVTPIKITKNDEKDIDETICSIKATPKQALKEKLDPQYVQETFYKCRKFIFHENEIYVKKVSKEVLLDNETKIIEMSDYNIHYNPYERYWLYLLYNIELFNKNKFNAYFNKHPGTFKLIFNECARIIEQSAQEFLHEFQLSELYLVFSATYCGKSKNRNKEKLVYRDIKDYVYKANMHW